MHTLGRRGEKVEVVLDPSLYSCKNLVAQLADEWVALIAVSQLSEATTRDYRAAIITFAEYVDQHAPSPELCSLDGPRDDLAPIVYEYGRQLPRSYPPGSPRPHSLSSKLRALINFRLQREDVDLQGGLRELLASRNRVPSGRTTEVDEFSRKEKAALVREAWAVVRAAEQRIREGDQLVAAAKGHPDQHGWCDLGNLLWAVGQSELIREGISTKLPPLAAWTEDMHAQVGSRSEIQARYARRFLLRSLVQTLYPTADDMHAFRILLIAATGHSPEEIAGLCMSDVDFIQSGVRLTLTKRRARRRGARRFDEPESALHTETGRINVVDLLRRLIAITERARALTGAAESAKLLLVTTVQPDLSVKTVPLQSAMSPKDRFHAWIEQHNLAISEPHDIRRLRKSIKVEKAIARKGSVDHVADDHTPQTFLRNYARGTTLRVVSGKLITQAQHDWFDRAVSGPSVLDAEAEDNLKSPESLDALQLTREQATMIVEGALNMGVCECKDPYNSPFAKNAGDLCPTAPLSCLECRNAIILPSNLPQLLLYADFLDGLRNRLSPPMFEAVWGQRRVNLLAALSERTPEDLDAARQQITVTGDRLQLPLAAYVEFNR
ncbi:hypothetical protein ABT095_19940 [Kitasatospora sp. NPDC002227]|uniref:hypothetical protein n=1 Tax=Kitasatospora sp. NPDC002227 TaxID=3154773 RepID=UPI00331C0BC4